MINKEKRKILDSMKENTEVENIFIESVVLVSELFREHSRAIGKGAREFLGLHSEESEMLRFSTIKLEPSALWNLNRKVDTNGEMVTHMIYSGDLIVNPAECGISRASDGPSIVYNGEGPREDRVLGWHWYLYLLDLWGEDASEDTKRLYWHLKNSISSADAMIEIEEAAKEFNDSIDEKLIRILQQP